MIAEILNVVLVSDIHSTDKHINYLIGMPFSVYCLRVLVCI